MEEQAFESERQSPASRLDTLWIQYLDLLDVYIEARDELSKHMASGFFSLAQANRSSTYGKRHGQDWYDQRMKATRRCRILCEQSVENDVTLSQPIIRIASWCPTAEEKPHSVRPMPPAGSGSSAKDSQPKQQPSPPSTPDPEPSEATKESTKDTNSNVMPPLDPIRWYGVLVPQELRRAQGSFVATIDNPPHRDTLAETSDYISDPTQQGPLIRANNSARGMRILDAEIRRLRKLVKKADRAAAQEKYQERSAAIHS